MKARENERQGGSSGSDGGIWDDDTSLDDHNVMVGFPAGTLVGFFMGNNNNNIDDHNNNNNNHTTSHSESSTTTTTTNENIATTTITTSATTTRNNDDSSFDRTILSSTPSEDIADDDDDESPERANSSFDRSLSELLMESHQHQQPMFYSTNHRRGAAAAADDSSFVSLSTTASEYRYVEWPLNQEQQQPPDLDSLSLHASMVDSCSVTTSAAAAAAAPTTTMTATSSAARGTTVDNYDSLNSSNQSITHHHHGSAVFVNIANHLTRKDLEYIVQSSNNNNNSKSSNKKTKLPGAVWYEGFDDMDWDQFRQMGQMILTAILESEAAASNNNNNNMATARLVPLALPLTDSLSEVSDSGYSTTPSLSSPTSSSSYPPSAQDVLPTALLCPLCHDVIVGVTVLDCGCAASTVCASCWQAHLDTCRDAAIAAAAANTTASSSSAPADVEEADFVWVTLPCPAAATAATTTATVVTPTTLPDCPTCQKQVHRVVACPALEAAIQEFLLQLPPSHDSLKRHYRRRFGHWRENCLQQQAKQRASLEDERRNNILAQLIAQEEEMLWRMNGRTCRGRNRHRNRSKALTFWQACGHVLTSEPFLLVVAAAISFSFGMKACTKK